jgi:uncharacterized membrane protein YfcA
MDKAWVSTSSRQPAQEALKAGGAVLFVGAFILWVAGLHAASGTFALVPVIAAHAWARARYPQGAPDAATWWLALPSGVISALVMALVHPDPRALSELPIGALFVATITLIMRSSLRRPLRPPAPPAAKGETPV